MSFNDAVLEKYAILGPGQTDTALPSTFVSRPFANKAEVPRPTQIHDLSTISLYFLLNSSGFKFFVSISFRFKF
ncbi:hypothetical protein ES705_50856 [subsurface metagenome]